LIYLFLVDSKRAAVDGAHAEGGASTGVAAANTLLDDLK